MEMAFDFMDEKQATLNHFLCLFSCFFEFSGFQVLTITLLGDQFCNGR